MATVPELKAIAVELGITGLSRMRKAEIEQAIAAKRAEIEQAKEALRGAREIRKNADRLGEVKTPESASNKINSADPSATLSDRAIKAQRAREAGSRGVSAAPLNNGSRELNYWNQFVGPQGREGFKRTPAQARRMRKKSNKAKGFNGCTITDYREMRRRMKHAGMIPAGQR